SSKNPSDTFTVLSHPPDLGISFRKEGNSANTTKGMANATEKPSMPIAGPSSEPFDTASTSKKPMIGPVQEKETSASVNAMKKMPFRPPRSDLESTLLTNRDGRLISKPPRKEIAKTSIMARKRRLNDALLAASFSADAPKRTGITIPSAT